MSKTTGPVYIVLLTLILCISINPVFADAAGNACATDYEKFCAEVEPGEGRIGQCLMQHREEITPDCAKFLEAATNKIVSAFIAACQIDVELLCADVEPGERRIINCLKNKQAELSSDCASVVNKL